MSRVVNRKRGKLHIMGDGAGAAVITKLQMAPNYVTHIQY
jgi:3-oxoacyl-[acyl-carrier-protein] synthase III